MTTPRELSRARGVLLVVAAFALFGACRTAPSTSSETHFLSWCSQNVPCGPGLQCSCGVCVAVCEDDRDCDAHAAGARCVGAVSNAVELTCSAEPDILFCEVSCADDADCADLGPSHRCDLGVCRQLAPDCIPGQTRGDEVALLGDNFLASSGELAADLQRLARGDGALGEDQEYRDHSSTLVGPFGDADDLGSQYAAARDVGPPAAVIMNAGGPDALLSCPDPPTSSCTALANAAASLDQLLARMATDGVGSVVLFFYPDPQDATLAAKFDVLRPMLRASCETGPVPCYFVDLRGTFGCREAELLQPGGILPTAAGASAAARTIWSAMRQHCVAQ